MIPEIICTPEDMLIPSPETPAGYPADAILCALKRADSVLMLLSGQFDKDCDRYSDETIANVIWSARGDLALAMRLVNHGTDSQRLLKDSRRKAVEVTK
jgi:hypothetical protein